MESSLAIVTQQTSATATDLDNEWLAPECLRAMAGDLEACVANGSPKMLADLRQCYPDYALRAASKLLTPKAQERIKGWVLEQNALEYPRSSPDQELPLSEPL